MSADRLRGILRDMADEAHPAPLTAGAVRRTRRARAWQTAIAVAAAIGVLAGLTAVLGPGRDERPEPAVSPEPSATSFTGAFYYLEPDGSVWRWRAGRAPARILDGGGYRRQTASVSPDGRYIAYVDVDMTLTVVPTLGGEPKKLLAYSPNLTCVEPVWTPDSRALLVSPRSDEGLWLVDIDDPADPYPLGYSIDGCHPRFSGDSPLDLIWVTTDGERIESSRSATYTAVTPLMRVTGIAELVPGTLNQFCAVTSRERLTTVPPRPLSCNMMFETGLGDQIQEMRDPPTSNPILDMIPTGPKDTEGRPCVAFREVFKDAVGIMCHPGYFGDGTSERLYEPPELGDADLLVYVP